MKRPVNFKFEPMLSTGQVAAALNVDPKTVNRWIKAGRIEAIRTPGGHYRVRESDVQAYLDGDLGDEEP